MLIDALLLLFFLRMPTYHPHTCQVLFAVGCAAVAFTTKTDTVVQVVLVIMYLAVGLCLFPLLSAWVFSMWVCGALCRDQVGGAGTAPRQTDRWCPCPWIAMPGPRAAGATHAGT